MSARRGRPAGRADQQDGAASRATSRFCVRRSVACGGALACMLVSEQRSVDRACVRPPSSGGIATVLTPSPCGRGKRSKFSAATPSKPGLLATPRVAMERLAMERATMKRAAMERAAMERAAYLPRALQREGSTVAASLMERLPPTTPDAHNVVMVLPFISCK